MQFPRTGVSIMYGREAMATQNFIEFLHKRREILRIDRGILYDGDRFGVSRYVRKQTQCGFAQAPYTVLVRAPDNRIVITKAGSTQFGFKPGGYGGDHFTRRCG